MIFDAHADILTHIHQSKRKGFRDIFKMEHLEGFKKSNIRGGIFTIWIDPYTVEDSKEELIETIANISNEILENKDIFNIIRNGDSLKNSNDPEKINMIMGVEGLKCIEDNTDLIDMLYIYGIRHVSLTWNEENLFATGVDGDSRRGITDKGKEILKKLETMNMIIDLSHANEKTFWDIIANTSGVLIASHSNSKTICDHKRNLTDRQLKAIKDRNGVIGVNVHRHFVGQVDEEQNIEKLVDHIDYMKKIIGIDHIGFGFDFCEYLDGSEFSSIDELNNASDLAKLIEALKQRGYTTEDIAKISYKNFYRVIEEILK